jgi:carbon-monoxide dehydrogenase large subunit
LAARTSTAFPLGGLERGQRSWSCAICLLQADASEVSFSAGRFTAGGQRGIDLLALAEAARDPANLPDGMSPGIEISGRFLPKNGTNFEVTLTYPAPHS